MGLWPYHLETCLASEFCYCDPIVDASSLIISQSGETADTLAAIEKS